MIENKWISVRIGDVVFLCIFSSSLIIYRCIEPHIGFLSFPFGVYGIFRSIDLFFFFSYRRDFSIILPELSLRSDHYRRFFPMFYSVFFPCSLVYKVDAFSNKRERSSVASILTTAYWRVKKYRLTYPVGILRISCSNFQKSARICLSGQSHERERTATRIRLHPEDWAAYFRRKCSFLHLQNAIIYFYSTIEKHYKVI